MTTKNIYKITGSIGNLDYKIVADNIKEAVDLYHEIVRTECKIKEIVYLFPVYINDSKKKMD